MDTIQAYMRMRQYKDQPMRVLDWERIAELIRVNNPVKVVAGIKEDLENTEGSIYESGQVVVDECLISFSNWGTPVIVMDGKEIVCYKYDFECSWKPNAIWPTEAIRRLS